MHFKHIWTQSDNNNNNTIIIIIIITKLRTMFGDEMDVWSASCSDRFLPPRKETPVCIGDKMGCVHTQLYAAVTN